MMTKERWMKVSRRSAGDASVRLLFNILDYLLLFSPRVLVPDPIFFVVWQIQTDQSAKLVLSSSCLDTQESQKQSKALEI